MKLELYQIQQFSSIDKMQIVIFDKDQNSKILTLDVGLYKQCWQ